MAETKRATKKALNEFCVANELSNEKIVNVTQKLFPDVFDCSDEFCAFLIKALFKNFETVTEKDVISYIKKLNKDKSIEQFKIEVIKQREKDRRVRLACNNLFARIVAETEQNDLRLSQCEEWNEEVDEYIKSRCAHWSTVTDENGVYHLENAFYKLFMYEHFKYDNPPFKIKCEGNDIVFCKQANQFERNKRNALLDKVWNDAKIREVRLSEYPEWDEALKQYLRMEYNDWRDVYTDSGVFSFARLFKRLLASRFSESPNSIDIPLFCYTTKTGDLLVSPKPHKWIESKECYDFEVHSTTPRVESFNSTTRNTNNKQASNGGCLSVIILVVIVALGLL